MKVNFEIENSTEISIDGKSLDLHNNFDFESIQYSVAQKQLVLTWAKAKGDWPFANDPDKLHFTHKNVSFFRIESTADKEFPDDDTCLGSIGYYSTEDRTTDIYFSEKALPNDDDDLIYRFETEQVVRVKCDEIVLSYE